MNKTTTASLNAIKSVFYNKNKPKDYSKNIMN